MLIYDLQILPFSYFDIFCKYALKMFNTCLIYNDILILGVNEI